MSSGWISAGIGFFGVVILTPLIGILCRRWNIYDRPGSLTIHATPIPRLAGIGIAAGVVAGTIAVSGSRAGTPQFALLLASFAAIWSVGLFDDLRGASPFLRLATQVASGILIWFAGWNLPLATPVVFSLLATCAIVVLCVNALNFLDGADGLAAGFTAINAGAYAVAYALNNGTKSLGFSVSCSLLGACLGFLIFNFPPASIFMGDSGSTILGFCVALMAIGFWGELPSPIGGAKWVFPAVIAALPLIDALVVTGRRLRRGQSAFAGDRNHFYDSWLARAWPPRRVALTSYAVTASLAVVGLSAIGADRKTAGRFVAAIVATVLVISALRVAAISAKAQDRPQIHEHV